MTGRILLYLPLMAILGFSDTGAQEPTVVRPATNHAPEPVSSVVVAGTTFFRATVAIGPEHEYSPAVQLEEEEPGSFLLGAFVGAAVAFFYLQDRSERGGDGEPPLPWVPVGALAGGMVFWSAGIG